jgi:hypothetical protein
MKYPVLCFDRDQTVDVNPPMDGKSVPLSWIQYYAHKTDLHVWATGNQQLQIEAAIPTPYEARQLLIDNEFKVEYHSGGGHKYRTDRLKIIDLLYNKISEDPKFIVVDDSKLSGFCSRNEGWNWYSPDDFVKQLNDIDVPEPKSQEVSGEPYYDTEKYDTYNEMLETLYDKIKSRTQ